MNDFLRGSIRLDDIREDMISTAENGKRYLNIIVAQRREVSKYGNTHYIKVSVPKEKKNPELNYYIGDLKPGDDGGQK